MSSYSTAHSTLSYPIRMLSSCRLPPLCTVHDPRCQHAGCPPAQRVNKARQVHVSPLRAANSQPSEEPVLSWSFTEGSPADSIVPPEVHPQAAHTAKHKPHKKQPQAQKQQQLPAQQQSSRQRRQHTAGKQRTAGGASSSSSTAITTSRPRNLGSRPISEAGKAAAAATHGTRTGSGRRAAPAAPDPYQQAQQRVRAVLAAADPADPTAAAARLPDTVNDLTIALQLLATAPRPASQAAYRQYDAAVQQLASAVLNKYKQLLLHMQGPPSAQQPQEQQQGGGEPPQQQQQQQQQQQLAAALASLPATKLAAAAFSMGVLRLYDSQLVAGLEEASLLLLRRNAFKTNQLGQVVQGFVYLDHPLDPRWHAGFLEATRAHLGSMQGPQLASLAVWLTAYGLCGTPTSKPSSSDLVSSSSMGSVVGVPASKGGLSPAAMEWAPAPVSPMAPAAVAVSPSAPAVSPDPAWTRDYLAAVGRQAGRLKQLQLVQVLQAAAALRQQQQQQEAVAAAAEGNGLQQNASTDGRSSSSSSSRAEGSSSWTESLMAAVQQQLPELTMAHLAAALPALLVLTQPPWPPQLLAPVLLQVRVQLPGCSGRDLVAVAQAAALLAGPDALAAEQEWCDAVLVQLHAQLPTLSPGELAGAVHAVSLLRVRPYKAWVYGLCQRLRVEARAMDAQQVLVTLEGLAAVGIQLDPEVLHAFVLQVKRYMGSWDAAQLGRAARALRGMYPKVLPGRTVQQLVEELQRRQQFLALQAQQQTSVFGAY